MLKAALISIVLIRQAGAGEPPTRIVTLAPNLTEICCALGLREHLVGVTNYCTYPPSVAEIPKVGDYLNPNLEVLLALEPDLVLAVPEHQQVARRLQALGLRVETLRNWSIADIYATTMRIGEIAERSQSAATLVANLRAKVDELSRDRANHPSVLMTIGRDASEGSIRNIFVVARNGFLNEMLDLAGGVNAYPQPTPYFAQISQETIIALNPDMVIELIPEADVSPERIATMKRQWQSVPHVGAVKNNRVIALHGDGILTPGPRFVETLAMLRAALDQQ